ncbi:MAG: histidine phosphatase family protein [Anaerolineales bacterium]|nr:histidine phosphatase family protein [Anaerolineales bacterium]
MKTLLIMRHAKSSWQDGGLADHERPLNKRGQRDAPRMGQLLLDNALEPEAILASTAMRARATAEAVAEALGFEGEIGLERGFYSDAPEAYFDVVRRLPDGVDTALVIGHNPGLEDLLETLTGEDEHLPTAAIAQVRLPIASWTEFSPEVEGSLARVWRPREI